MSDQDNNKFMERAIALSLENVKNNHGGPFGAVIVKNNEIIAEGANQVTAQKDPTAHAEMVAIRNACKKLNDFHLHGCILYTSCEPCPMCLGAIYWARLQSVFYGNTKADAQEIGFDDSFIYKQIARAPELRTIAMKQLMHEQAREAFDYWRNKKQKIPY